ncbi:unnamed protein product [Phytomonas sp. Hart1]|nr:unnamed protein product [Phytomonas sp. Hart1]|eukprot:CCW67296.1 unnamed protein product [Phytomonas sp. isolate Hart1]
MNPETIYVFDPTTQVSSHPANNEGVVYVSAPPSTATGATLQLVQGAMLPPLPSASPDSVPNQSHVLSVNAYPVSYTVLPSSNQTYDVNHFDLTRYAALGAPIHNARPPFGSSFASQGQPPNLKTIPLYLLSPLGQEQQPSPNSVNSSFAPGFAYLEAPYMGGSSTIHTPHTTATIAATQQQLNIIPSMDQGPLTMLPVPTSSPVHPLMGPQKTWSILTTSLNKSPEPATPSHPLGLCKGANSPNLVYPLVEQHSSSSTASVAHLKSPAQSDMHKKFPIEYHPNPSPLSSKGKQLPRFMGVRGFLAPPPLGSRIVPGTTTLLDIPPLALPEPRWGILPQAALLAE